MKRKIFSVLFALVLALGLILIALPASPVLAAGTPNPTFVTIDVGLAGMSIPADEITIRWEQIGAGSAQSGTDVIYITTNTVTTADLALVYVPTDFTLADTTTASYWGYRISTENCTIRVPNEIYFMVDTDSDSDADTVLSNHSHLLETSPGVWRQWVMTDVADSWSTVDLTTGATTPAVISDYYGDSVLGIALLAGSSTGDKVDAYLDNLIVNGETLLDEDTGTIEVLSGTINGTPWTCSIQDGIDAALSGDTVNVAADTYNENITLKDGVDVMGAGDDVTTIFGTGIGSVVIASGLSSGTTLDGFTITNGSDITSNGGGMYNNNSTLTVSNCTFALNTAGNGGGMYNTSSNVTVSNCTFDHNMAITSGGGMYNSSSSPTVTNCTFNLNSAGNGGGMYNNNSSPTVTNCILWGDTGGEIVDEASTPVVTYCDVQGGYAGTGNIGGDPGDDPLFVGGGDLHLQAGSPCIDVGNDAAAAGITTDFEGDSRFIDGDGDTFATVDMGVDEYKPPPTEVWVDDDYYDGGPNDGHTWGYDAFDVIQNGINAVASPGTVHVAAGTYNENITLRDGVDVLGAGAGNSIIDGNGTGIVVTATSIGASTTFDGFTITHGSASYGAGMKNDGSTLTVSNCTFDSNTATASGGGMQNTSSNVTVSNCTFSNNSAAFDGGGMNNGSSSPTVTGCTFYHNTSSEYGGGMNNNSSHPTVIDCVFDDNSATIDGGGVYNRYQSPQYINCTFSDNYAARGGGMFNYYSTPTVTNCTFEGNSSVQGGSGMFNDNSTPMVTNCILWGDASDEIANISSSPTVTYCDIQGGYTGTGNIGDDPGDDPLFVDAGSGDYHLQATSPCIDVGSNAAVAGITTDFEGDDRIVNGVVDMGADEYVPPPLTEVWVDDDYYDGGPNDGHTWGYDAFDVIQNGINAVASPGTVHVATGIYYELITLRDGVDVMGAGAGNSIIDGGGTGIVVTATSIGASTTFDGFTITHGSASYGAGMKNDGSTLTVSNCTFSSNTASVNGGGIYNNSSSSPTLTDCTFSGNSATDGGGMYNEGSSPTVSNCTFSANPAGYGGGMYNYDGSSPTVTDCNFSGNSASGGDGGGMYNNLNSSPTVSNCTFSDNPAGYGGGMFNYWHSSPTVTDCTFSGNSAANDGGGMCNGHSSPELTNCTFSANSATDGGGIYNYDSSSPTVTDCTFSANTAGNGGGMDNSSSSPTVDTCTFTGNTATWFGGGMNNDNASPTVDTCTFDSNSADYGGGMHNYNNSSPTVTGCTFTGNTVTESGGGMFSNTSSPTVTGCTFSTNHADWYGGGMCNHYNASPTITDCEFNANTANYGGGMSSVDDGGLVNTEPVINDCTFVTNDAGYGGGMFNTYYVEPQVTNCIFDGNTADYGGGMENINWSSAVVVNCTFYNNEATSHGSGTSNNYYATPTLVNCILWDGGDEIYTNNDAVPAVTYCDVQGGYTGTGNINTDPLFVEAGTGNFHLQAGSPCIDAGDNATPSLPTTDFEGDPRSLDGDGDSVATVDMGVDECLSQVWVDDNADPGWYDATHLDTIQGGIDIVVPGGTVNVYPGDYDEQNIAINKSLTVQSVSGDWHDTKINAAGGDGFQFISFAGDATISGFTINHGTYGIYIEGTVAGSSITVSNCHIYEAGNAGIFGGDGLYGDIFIDDCVIGKNGWDGGTGGIHLDNTVAGTVEITDSVIGAYWDGTVNYLPNTGDGIQIDSIFTTGNVLIDNCKIVNNTVYGISDAVWGCHGTLTITNNIIGAYDYDPEEPLACFTGNGNWGIHIDYVGGAYVGGIGTVTIEGNKLAENDGGILIQQTRGETTISNNYVGTWTQTIGDTEVTHLGNSGSGIIIDNAPEGSLLIQGNNVSGNGSTGIYVANNDDGVGEVTEVTIDGNTLDDNGTGGNGVFLNNVWFATISNNTLTRHIAGTNLYAGVYLSDSSQNIITDNTIEENWVGIYIDEDSQENKAYNNTIQDNAMDGILIEGDENDIIGNDISGNLGGLPGCGIYLAWNAEANVINYNNITQNTLGGSAGVYNASEVAVDATLNWWGDASGPSGVGPGTGDAVSDHVLFDPWLGQEWSNEVWVDDDYTPATPGWGVIRFASIQTAIDTVPAGTTINVAAGMYDEDPYIDKSLTIQGAGADATFISGMMPTIVTINLGWRYAGWEPLAETVVFDGFTVFDEDTLIYLPQIINGSSVTISNNILYDCGTAIYCPGTTTLDSSSVIIENNEIYNAVEGIDFELVAGGSELAIQNNNIHDNDCGIFLASIIEESTVAIQNNNIHDNEDGIAIDEVSADSTVAVVGNTITDNTMGDGDLESGIHLGVDVNISNVRVNFNNIVDNGPYGVVYEHNNAISLNARNNWWGSTNGPGEDGANDVSDNVNYEPWLAVPIIGGKSGNIGAGGTLDATRETGVAVDVTSGSATVTGVKYAGNPVTGSFSGGTGQYLDIQLADITPGTEIMIKLYYTNAEIAGKVETSLRLQWWDGDSWEACSDGGVNTTDIPAPPPAGAPYSGYMWARITDTSTPSISELFGTPFGGGGQAAGGGGGLGTVGTILPHDTTTPQISNVLHKWITRTTVYISWTTNEPSTSQVEYWAPTGMLSPLHETLVTEHLVHLSGLTPCTTYRYQVMSKDEAGNPAVSNMYTFNTLGEAILTSSDLAISPSEANIGETVTISATVTNTGSCPGSYTVVLKINGTKEAEKSITVAAGSSESVSFNVTREEAGSYSIDVNGLTGSFTVAAPAAPAPIAWWIWVIIGVVVVGLIIFFLVRRRAY